MLGTGAVVAMGLVLVQLYNRSNSDEALRDAGRSIHSIVPPAALDARASAHPAPDLPDDRPFSERRTELERRAAAGDGHAARRLGMALANCNHYVPLSDAKLEELVVDTAARGVTIRQDGHELPPDEVLTKLKVGLAQKARDCKGVSGVDESDGMLQAFRWIERGAALGDADAQAMYGSLAFTSYDVRSALANAELIRERKQRAIDYLQASLDQGDALALLQMWRHYSEGGLFLPNAEIAYAYLYAYSLSPRASEIEPELLYQMLEASAGTLDEEARERAEAQGLQLSACCQVAVPEGQ